jgi:hypothetical protein
METKQFTCGSFTRAVYSTNSHGLVLGFQRFYCKSWSCPHCARKKAYAASEKMKNGFKGSEVRFMTLTVPDLPNKEKQAKDLSKSWNRLRLAITRKFGTFKYAKVLEFQPQTGSPHYHILLDIYIPKVWLNEHAVKTGFGQICDIKKVGSESIIGYLIKYLTKGGQSEESEKIIKKLKLRRLSYSRHFEEKALPDAIFHTLGSLGRGGCAEKNKAAIETVLKEQNIEFKPYNSESNALFYSLKPKLDQLRYDYVPSIGASLLKHCELRTALHGVHKVETRRKVLSILSHMPPVLPMLLNVIRRIDSRYEYLEKMEQTFPVMDTFNKDYPTVQSAIREIEMKNVMEYAKSYPEYLSALQKEFGQLPIFGTASPFLSKPQSIAQG